MADSWFIVVPFLHRTPPAQLCSASFAGVCLLSTLATPGRPFRRDSRVLIPSAIAHTALRTSARLVDRLVVMLLCVCVVVVVVAVVLAVVVAVVAVVFAVVVYAVVVLVPNYRYTPKPLRVLGKSDVNGLRREAAL
jgi:hypothetical protein